MSINLAAINSRVYARLAADMSSPTYSKIHANNIATFANELTAKVIWFFVEKKDLAPIQALLAIDESIALTTGIGALPTDYEAPAGVKVSSSKLRAKLYLTADAFNLWDSSNFIVTPTTRKPIAFVADGNLYVKPTSYTVAYLDYIKTHPTLTGAVTTSFSTVGDTILVSLIVARCFDFLEEYELANTARFEAGVGVK